MACQMAGRRLRGAQICQTLADAVVTQAREVKASFHTWLVLDMDGEREGTGGEWLACLSLSLSPPHPLQMHTYAHIHRAHTDNHTHLHTHTQHSSYEMLSSHDQIKPHWESQVKISQWWIHSALMANGDNKYYFCCQSQPLSVNKYWNKLLHWKKLWKVLSKHHRGFWL